MKIAIVGNIIDTDNIYQITPIVGNGCWSDDHFWGPETILIHSGYGFTIKLFNKKDIEINLDGSDIFEDEFWWMYGSSKTIKLTQEEYEKKLKIIYNELDAFRNTIVTFWNKDKCPIPQLEFNIKKR